MSQSRTLAVLFGACLVPVLSGCSWFDTRSGQDPGPTLREALEVPPDLARPATADPLVSSGGVKPPVTASAAPSTAAAATTGSATTPARVTLERDGAQRWLMVQDSTDRVIARVRAMLISRQLELAVDNPKAGIFETEWKEKKINLGTNALTRLFASLHSTGLRDKFRIRIEPGRVAGTSEVYVSHQGLEEVVVDKFASTGSTAWQPRAADVQAEAELLMSLMTSFGLSEQQAKDQFGNADTQGARVVKDGLLLQQDFDQTWRRVGQALDRSGFVIEDRDRAQGAFYVYDRNTEAKVKRGLLGGWLKFGESEEVIETRFQVVLKTADQGTLVRILNVKGEKTEAKNSQRLFDYLQQQLQ